MVSLPDYWIERIQAQRLPHALILTGTQRDDALAPLLAGYLCEKEGARRPCGLCAHCRKVQEGIHPDVIFPDAREEMKVDDVRALRGDAYIRPNEGQCKIYVIRMAEKLNASAQNALLKLLEEGPPYLVILLLLPNPEALLPTLRSRCACLSLSAVDEQEKEEQAQQVQDFLAILTKPAPRRLPLLTACVALEKKSRDEMRDFLDLCIEQLVPLVGAQPTLLLPRLDALRKARAACEVNIGAGHLAGLLMAHLI